MGLQAATVNEVTRLTLPTAAALCAASGGAACAAGAAGAVGIGSFWLVDQYVNPWLQPMLAAGIDACIAGKDAFAKQTEYLHYKNKCDTPPPPSGDICEDMRRQIKRLEECRELRQKWDGRYWPGRHAEDIRRAAKALKDAMRVYANAWSCHHG